jgi:DNA helicase IV
VLVVGPNPLFLNYIENVLPSLGESGVTLSTISGLVRNVEVRASETEELARLKGDERMVSVIARAVRTRQRPLREDVNIRIGRAVVVLRAADTEEAVSRAKRRPGNHNQRRSGLGRELALRLAQRYHERFLRDAVEIEGDSLAELAEQIRLAPEFKEAMRRMWPRLTGQELLHDLFGAAALIRAAGRDILSDEECELLVRARSASLSEVRWTDADAALIDEARVILGPRRKPRTQRNTGESEQLRGSTWTPIKATNVKRRFARQLATPNTSRTNSTRPNSSPTATLSSTRPKTCRRCSCAFFDAAITRDR